MKKLFYFLSFFILIISSSNAQENHFFTFGKIYAKPINKLTEIPENKNCKFVADGGKLVIREDGTLWELVYNPELELEFEYKQIGKDKDWKIVSKKGNDQSAYYHAIKENGTLWSWGSNHNAVLGLGENAPLKVQFPTQVGTENDWAKVEAGSNVSFALKNNGTLWGWGLNDYDEITTSYDNFNFYFEPTRINYNFQWKDIKINPYFQQIIAITGEGRIVRWGQRNVDIFNNPIGKPEIVSYDTDWTKIEFGYDFILAIKNDSTLWGIGDNEYFQLGVKNVESAKDFINIDNYSKWVDISASGYPCLGIKSDGTLWMWGGNEYLDEMKEFENEDGYVDEPTQVGYMNDWVSVSSFGNQYVCLKESSVLNVEKYINLDFVKLFPNPTNDIINIDLSGFINNDIDVVIYNLNGIKIKNLYKGIIGNSNNHIKYEANNLTKGTYFVLIKSNNEIYTNKFILK